MNVWSVIHETVYKDEDGDTELCVDGSFTSFEEATAYADSLNNGLRHDLPTIEEYYYVLHSILGLPMTYEVVYRTNKHDGPPPIRCNSLKDAQDKCINLLSESGAPVKVGPNVWEVDFNNDTYFAYIQLAH